ncbi:MAG: sarcinarray family MAST domain-containing protein [Candidatus Methanoperedens sp.]|nr:sarcinarray family MAST domain-containing protein [Candidatus Methanoperedens sp.]
MKLVLFVIVLLLSIQNSFAAENEYGIVNAWFNEKNATVEGFSMKIGESAEIKVEVTSKIDGNVYVELNEPGITKSYNVVNGPSKFDESIDNLKIESGWSKTFTWIVAPNGAWKNGNAPINIFVEFSKIKTDKKIQFTIANPYILDEQYPGSTPAQTTGAAQPSPTGTSSKPQQSPFMGTVGVIAAMLCVLLWMRRT